MSERTFFSLRYTIPGYVFILWNLLLNLRFVAFFFLHLMPAIDPSSNITALFGVFLGFLTLLSGGAIGFLVSQFWYLIYWLIIAGFLSSRYAEELIEKHQVKDKEASVQVFNYLLHSFKPKGIFSYIDRRWELLLLFGSTVTAIGLGSISGLILRYFVFGISDGSNSLVNWRIDIGVFAVSVVLIGVFVMSFRFVAKSYHEMSVFIIRSKAQELAKNKKKLKDELPEEYFKPQKNMCSEA